MRVLAFLLLALPAVAQSPTREIGYGCDDEKCYLRRSDWEWLMKSIQAKDRMLKLCGVHES